MTEIEICTINGTKWLLCDEAPKQMTWQDAKDWCESIGQQLPPREVLLMAYMNPEIRGGFANYYYWSSSEDDSNYAWGQSFGSGHQSYDGKNSTLPVRAVRAIKLEGLTLREGLAEYKKGYGRAELNLKLEPLSKEQYMKFFTNTYDSVNPITDFVRAIEKAHGIGGEE